MVKHFKAGIGKMCYILWFKKDIGTILSSKKGGIEVPERYIEPKMYMFN